jgi:cell division protein FtsQ
VNVVLEWLRRPWVWAVIAGLVLGGAAATLRFAPFFTVDQVSVVGNEQVSADEVRAVADVPGDTPLLTAPLDVIADRIESLDAVASVRVTRDWPDTVRIVVKERRAIGYVATGSTVLLVGSDGVLYREQDDVPRDLPQLPSTPAAVGESYTPGASEEATAAFTVAVALPHQLRGAVQTITADSVRDIRLSVAGGVDVEWGSTSATERKAEVVALLRQRPGWGRTFSAVDVSVPDAPALRDTPVG